MRHNPGDVCVLQTSRSFWKSVFGCAALVLFAVNVYSQAPIVYTQPQSQAVLVGTNVVLSVAVPSVIAPPSVSSGSLQLWLKADAGVVTNASGQVSLWQDQSGFTNDAVQADTNNQPVLVNSDEIGGMPTLQFNGNQDNVHGSYLAGTGNVGVPDAMTTFAVYNYFSTDPNGNEILTIGQPPVYGSIRSDAIYQGEMYFSTWSYDYGFPFLGPANTYRIWTTELNTNLSSVVVYDNTATTSNSFSAAVSGAIAPAPGYYVGGLNPAVQFVGNNRCFDGDIAELICYRGQLTDADRMAVQGYLQQKYFQTGSSASDTFQWQFDGTNIAGATDATLSITNAQMTADGTYTVIVTDTTTDASTTSSNAVLLVGYAPAITAQPESQEVPQGTNIIFSVDTTGTTPLNFQWTRNGASLPGATSSVLSLTNLQPVSSGTYAVTVVSPFGTAISSNAMLVVDPLPLILTQPQGQIAIVGTNVTLSATVSTALSPPSVSSGTLRLWLAADAGVVANGAGSVSLWRDQSGNSNDASQSNTNNQPELVYSDGIGGRPTLRFNGNQDNVHGSFLAGTGDVGVPNAMTTFAVYNYFSTDPNGNEIFTIGQPGAGALRSDVIYGGEMYFSTWVYDYSFPFLGARDTYRIWTTELNTNLNEVDVYDNSATSSNNFSLAVNNAVSPAPGYFVGGLNPAIPSVGSSRCFDGDIAELICYRGQLNDADRLAVQNYLQIKYLQPEVVTDNTFQWQYDGTNIAGATNATLTLTNIQISEDGAYSVTVTDVAGSTTSSNAVLLVGYPPSLTLQPQSQEIIQGSNVTFTATAVGTGPLSLQWTLNGVALEQATNSTLNLTNIQAGSAGSYVLTVTSPFGSAVSSNAVLTVDELPAIETQPQSQLVVVGSNATLSVVAGVSAVSPPSVTSGALRLWLKADAGVVTNGAGLVSAWRDQSGNTNDASQSDTNNQPMLVYSPGIGGMPTLRFNGNQDNVHGSYLAGSGNVGMPNAMTTFAVYNYFSTDPNGNEIITIGQPPSFGSIRSDAIYQDEMYFSTWGIDYGFPFLGASNTYRIWTTELNTNLNSVTVYDNTAATSNSFSAAVGGAVTPAAGYYVGGLNPALTYVVNNRCFDGDIAELICYRGQLTDSDRLGVQNYLEQKYFQLTAADEESFQWQFDGTNIAGATNATLTLTNVQGNQAGTYTVIVTDPAGSVTSSNAVLTALFPATITTSPVSQSVSAGTTVTFTGAASGTAPLGYQWQFDGTNIAGATNTSFTVNSAVIANDGGYAMVATNPYGSQTSSVATLSVDESTVQVVSASASAASTVVVSINLVALGTESGVGFTLNFDPTVLIYVDTAVGSGASGSAMQVNTNQVSSGHLGLGAAEFTGTFPAGTNDIFDITFRTSVVTNATTTSLTFGNSPANEEISDPSADSLPAVYSPGVVVISSTALEGDVSPRPNGDQVLNISDWVQEGRFVAGLDTITNASEFERADCAPRSTLGDGELTVADWVQVGRYAVGLDELTAIGGPTAPAPATRQLGHPGKDSDTPALTLVPLSQGAQMNSVSVELASQGEVNSAGFSVTYNPSLVQFVSATLGSGATGAAFIQNTNSATPGTLGFVVGSLAPATFPAGAAPLVTLNFAPVAFSNTTALAFADLPVVCQLADANAQPVSASFVSTSLAVGGTSWPTLSITPNGNSVSLTWPSSGTPFTLQAASSLDGAWTNVVATPTTNNSSVIITAPVSNDSVYYRLKY